MTRLDALWMNRIVGRMTHVLDNQLKEARVESFLPVNRGNVEKGIRFLLLFLRESILYGEPAIFLDNVTWYRRNHLIRSFPVFLLGQTLAVFRDVLGQEGDPAFRSQAVPLVEAAMARLDDAMKDQETYLEQPGVDQAACRVYLDALLSLEPDPARETVNAMLRRDPDVKRVYSRLFQPVLYETGRLWQTGEISVAQEHYVTESTRAIMDAILPSTDRSADGGQVFLGLCAENEQHSVGIRMVCDHFALGGWKSIFLGGNVPAGGVLDVVRRKHVSLVGISVSMPYNIHTAADIIRALREAADGACPPILVGGIAFNEYPDLWVKVGADAYTSTAEEALAKGLSLIAKA